MFRLTTARKSAERSGVHLLNTGCPYHGVREPRFMHKDRIAIIGIGCRFPGGVNDAESFWKLLLERRDAVSGVIVLEFPMVLVPVPTETVDEPLPPGEQ